MASPYRLLFLRGARQQYTGLTPSNRIYNNTQNGINRRPPTLSAPRVLQRVNRTRKLFRRVAHTTVRSAPPQPPPHRPSTPARAFRRFSAAGGGCAAFVLFYTRKRRAYPAAARKNGGHNKRSGLTGGRIPFYRLTFYTAAAVYINNINNYTFARRSR